MIVFGLVFIVCCWIVQGLNLPCCSQVPGSCRTSCEQMSLVTIAINTNDRRKYMQLLDVYCPKQLDAFWSCVNDTLKDVDLNSHWSGRPCCHLPRSNGCQFTCLMSQNRSNLLTGCRQSDEISFYDCLDNQEVGERCCSAAKTDNCAEACREVFVSNSQAINHLPRGNVETLCSGNSPSVLSCVLNHTRATPSTNSHKNLHCCERSDNEQCRSTCKKVLKAGSSSQEAVMDTLIQGGCGYPRLHDSLWQCFLSNSEINRPGGAGGLVSSNSKRTSSSTASGVGGKLGSYDSAKLHCCLKASSFSCQKLCFKTFSDDWESTWKSFHRLCMYQPTESKMLRCIEEVDEPCELGCDGLSYCNHFNNRPTQMFRSCNTWTDHGARSEVDMWKTGFINTSSISIPIVDTGQCFPSMWKSIACTLAVKPCSNHHSFTGLCRSDCIDTLTRCVDYSRLPTGITPSAICDMLLPTGHDVSCTPLSTYLSSGRSGTSHYGHRDRVTFPCRPNPCNSSHICMLNRECDDEDKCPLYKCVLGCRMGDTSHLLVPPGAVAYIPSSGIDAGCYKICRCSSRATFEDCVVLPCQSTDGCLIGGKKIPHRSTFQFDHNTCLCFAGEVTCTTQECSNVIGGGRITDGTGLPCNSPSHYVPVCGFNGRTYPSACVAMCSGLSEDKILFGTCSSIDPCQPNPCKRNQKCVIDRKVCLWMDDPTKCVQYQCVEKTKDCAESASGAVCDTTQKQFTSLCSLLAEERTFSYKGHCIVNCKNSGIVCGQDGETYSSECVALSARTLVDYDGPCSTFVRTAGRGSSVSKCESIKCPRPVSDKCQLVTPPGACCSICGAAIRLLLNQRQTLQIQHFLMDGELLTVRDVVDAFRQHVKVSKCDVYGYLSVDGEVVLVLTTNTDKPTLLQLQACSKEAEKLESRINTGSPLVVSNFKLSSITLAIAVEAHSWANLLSTSNLCLVVSVVVHTWFTLDQRFLF